MGGAVAAVAAAPMASVAAAALMASVAAYAATGSAASAPPRRSSPTRAVSLILAPPAPVRARSGTAAAAVTPASPVAGAGPLPAGWAAAAHSVRIGGLARVYLRVEPARLPGPVPVVLLIPGRFMTPDGILHISGLASRIGPAVVVVPAGWQNSWNSGDCCGAAYLHGVDDVTFLTRAVDQVLASTPQAEAGRVYAVGFSNGGRMAYDLACHDPGLFAGYLAVEAVPVEACPARRPHDMTIVAQQNDPLLTVLDGQRPKTIEGFVEPTVEDVVARLRRLDRCAGAPAVRDRGSAVERTWHCPAGTVRYVWYPRGRHSWRPATSTTPGATDFVLQLVRGLTPGG